MKVGVRCFYVVGRPPVNFRRIRSSFDAPTVNYSGSIAGLTSDVFGLRKQSPGLSLLFSQPKAFDTIRYHHQAPKPFLSAQFINPSRAFESYPGPDPDSRHRWIRIIPKHL